jgi:hypothetical protein
VVFAPGNRARRADPLRVRVARRYVALVLHSAIGGNGETGKVRGIPVSRRRRHKWRIHRFGST